MATCSRSNLLLAMLSPLQRKELEIVQRGLADDPTCLDRPLSGRDATLIIMDEIELEKENA